MIVQASDLPFVSISRSAIAFMDLNQLKDSIMHLKMENEKVRVIPHVAVAPLAVSDILLVLSFIYYTFRKFIN
ncbi:hypothetical protein SLE2022_390990 [Rubroshorea leprosula]